MPDGWRTYTVDIATTLIISTLLDGLSLKGLWGAINLCYSFTFWKICVQSTNRCFDNDALPQQIRHFHHSFEVKHRDSWIDYVQNEMKKSHDDDEKLIGDE